MLNIAILLSAGGELRKEVFIPEVIAFLNIGQIAQISWSDN